MNTLQLVNKVLLEMGERTVAVVSETPASRKVFGMVQEAVDSVNYEHSWSDLMSEVLISSLVDVPGSILFSNVEVKSLPDKYLSIERLVNITNGNTLAFSELREFTNSTKSNVWTIWKSNLVIKTDFLLDNIAMVYFGSFTIPADPATELLAPEYLQQLYALRLLFKAVARHLNNMDLAAVVFQEYTAALLSYNVVTKMNSSARESQTFNLPMFQGANSGVNTSSQRS